MPLLFESRKIHTTCPQLFQNCLIGWLMWFHECIFYIVSVKFSQSVRPVNQNQHQLEKSVQTWVFVVFLWRTKNAKIKNQINKWVRI